MENQQPVAFQACFAFGLNPNDWERGFGERRCEGYAHALEFCNEVIIFSPHEEFPVMCDAMQRHGADLNRISWHKTLSTTFYNAVEMKKMLNALKLNRENVCISSSWYHARAPYFADERHKLRLTFIPAEAFTFAVCPEDQLQNLTNAMCADFGEGTRILVEDIRGLGRDITGKYRIPPQPKK